MLSTPSVSKLSKFCRKVLSLVGGHSFLILNAITFVKLLAKICEDLMDCNLFRLSLLAVVLHFLSGSLGNIQWFVITLGIAAADVDYDVAPRDA